MVRIQDDFYEAVNGEWEKTAVIPSDKPRTGGFSDLADDIERWLLQTTSDWQKGQDLPDDAILNNFVKYHRLASDFTTRNELGSSPIRPFLKQYQSFSSFADFASHIADLEKAGLPNAFPFGVEPDFKDARTNVLWAGGLDILFCQTQHTTLKIIHRQKCCLLSFVKNKRLCCQNLVFQKVKLMI